LREIIKVDYYISKISRCIKQARGKSEFALLFGSNGGKNLEYLHILHLLLLLT